VLPSVSMPIPRRYTTEAIVLSRFDYGEADRILTLMTPGGGKLKAIAKGVRRQTSRLGGSLEPFAELRLLLARGRTFDVVTQVEIIHPWLRMRDDLVSFGTAEYLAELADGTLEERHASEAVYVLLKRAYEILDAGMAAGRVARWFEMHLADELGIRPEVDRCVECSRLLAADERYRWVPPLGGVLCERCPGPPHDRVGLSLDGLKLLKAYQRMDVEAIAALRMRPEVEREVERGMREFLAYSLDRSPRSLAFLDEIRRPGQERGRSAVSRTLGRADAAVVAAAVGVGSSEPVEGLAPA
jgi:DNA repair protein RecO (recombination protein O)